VGGLFSLETISFVVQKLFNFMKSHLSILSLSCRAAGVLLRKKDPVLSERSPSQLSKGKERERLLPKSNEEVEYNLVSGLVGPRV
jgi:hypothetical protein